MKVKVLDRKREGYEPEVWKEYDLLYQGGYRLERKKERFLPKNPAETDAWWRLRLAQFHYKNLVGTALDEIAGATLQSPVELDPKAPEGSTKRPEADEFYTDTLWPDPTGTGEGTLQDLLHEVLIDGMKWGEAWVMVAFPGGIPGFVPANRAEQEAAGLLRAQLRRVEPEAVINCGHDEHGLASVMLRHRICPDELLVDDTASKDLIVWTYLTRKTRRAWGIEVEPGKEPGQDDEAQEILAETPHMLAEANDGTGLVPVMKLPMRKSLWALDRIASLGRNELCKRNAISWYEHVACYPLPYHKGESSLAELAGEGRQQARGVQYWLEIGPEDEVGYLEPDGGSLPHIKDRLDQLERDVFKALHNMAAAQGPEAAAVMQAAASKLRDSVAKQILCEEYAKVIRDFAVQVADAVSEARQDDVRWEASGADQFDLMDSSSATEGGLVVQGISALGKSPTFQRAYWKKVALALVPEVDTTTRDQIAAEFDAMEVVDPDEEQDQDDRGEDGGDDDKGGGPPGKKE